MKRPNLESIVRRLEREYGPPEAPRYRSVLDLILWENVAYMADDRHRRESFLMLSKEVGTRPDEILAAPRSVLEKIGSHGGILPGNSADKLREAALIARKEFDGEPDRILKLPLAAAKKALRKFPGIGEPGAEKILLFTETHPLLALESNGLRALLRLGFGRAQKSYAATYRAVQGAAQERAPENCKWRIKAHLLLRRHGQQTCKRSAPLCTKCPVMNMCEFAAPLRLQSRG